VVAATICNLLIGKVFVRLLLSVIEGNTHEELMDLALINYPRMQIEKGILYAWTRMNQVPHHVLEIQTSLPQGYSICNLAVESIPVVSMRGIVEPLKTVRNRIAYGTKL